FFAGSSWLALDCWQAFDPKAQIFRQDQCRLASLQCAELATLVRLIKTCPAYSRCCARLGYFQCNRILGHLCLAFIGREGPSDRARVIANIGEAIASRNVSDQSPCSPRGISP